MTSQPHSVYLDDTMKEPFQRRSHCDQAIPTYVSHSERCTKAFGGESLGGKVKPLPPSRDFRADRHMGTDMSINAKEREREYQAIEECATLARGDMLAARIAIHNTFCLLREPRARGRMSEEHGVRLCDELQAARERFHGCLHALKDARMAMRIYEARQ